jgi:hypothetical protein
LLVRIVEHEQKIHAPNRMRPAYSLGMAPPSLDTY